MKRYTVCIGQRKDEPDLSFIVVFTGATDSHNVNEHLHNKFRSCFRDPSTAKFIASGNADYYFKIFELAELGNFSDNLSDMKKELATKTDIWGNLDNTEVTNVSYCKIELPDWRTLSSDAVSLCEKLKTGTELTTACEVYEEYFSDVFGTVINIVRALGKDKTGDIMDEALRVMQSLDSPIYHTIMSTLKVRKTKRLPEKLFNMKGQAINSDFNAINNVFKNNSNYLDTIGLSGVGFPHQSPCSYVVNCRHCKYRGNCTTERSILRTIDNINSRIQYNKTHTEDKAVLEEQIVALTSVLNELYIVVGEPEETLQEEGK